MRDLIKAAQNVTLGDIIGVIALFAMIPIGLIIAAAFG